MIRAGVPTGGGANDCHVCDLPMKASSLTLAILPVFVALLRAQAVPLTMKDLAIEEARAFDKDKNNKIEGIEAFALRAELKNNLKSHLYMFDDNSNHYLDDGEISKIPLGPPPARPGAAPKPAPAHHGKHSSNPAMHPHGA